MSKYVLAALRAVALFFGSGMVCAEPFAPDREYLFKSCQSLNRYDAPDYAATATKIGRRLLTDEMKYGINAILDSWEKSGDGSRERLAYVLATARRESVDTFRPVREAASCGEDEACRERAIGRHLEKKAKERSRPAKANYARADEDGRRYYGRGFVQLTHKATYEHAAHKTGIPLDKEPDMALEPKVAAEILIRGMLEGWYGKRRPLSAYIADNKLDWFNARDTVNPESPHKAITAEYARDLLSCLRRKR